jgi:hypothetical protein
MLLGKGEAAARRAWIEDHGNETEADIQAPKKLGSDPFNRNLILTNTE